MGKNNNNGNVQDTNIPGSGIPGQVVLEGQADVVPPNNNGNIGDNPGNREVPAGSNVSVKPTTQVKLANTEDELGSSVEFTSVANFTAAGSGGSSPVKDASGIPSTQGGYRPNTRSGRQNVLTEFLIDNTVCEVPEVEFTELPPLYKSDSKYSGFIGRSLFKTTRGKKNGGKTPHDILYERSIDFVEHDATIHLTGQVIQEGLDTVSGYPTITAKLDADTTDAGYINLENNSQGLKPMKKSNYLIKAFNFTIKDGRIETVSFDEDELETHALGGVIEKVNANAQVDRNVVAKTVVTAQKNFGSDSAEKWTPLAFAARQIYQIMMLYHDMEAVTGAIVGFSDRAANSSIAYTFQNVLKKDGSKNVTPIIEAFLGGIGKLPHSIGFGGNDTSFNTLTSDRLDNILFNKTFLKEGSAAAIIAMQDSLPKYATKSKYITLPLSLKKQMEASKNYKTTFYMKEEALMAYDTVHTYSTVDGKYNPLLPIYATDKVSIVSPMSLNYFLKGWNRNKVDSSNTSGLDGVYRYKWRDLRNQVTVVDIRHPLLEGLLTWMVNNETQLVKAYGRNATVRIPVFFSNLHPSMFQMMIVAATEKIAVARATKWKDILTLGGYFRDELKLPLFSDLKKIGTDIDNLYSSNLSIKGWNVPLELGKLKPASFLHLMWNESYTVVASNDPAVGYKNVDILLPWFQSESQFSGSYDEFFMEFDPEQRAQFLMPSIRPGVRHEYVDYLYSLDDRDVRLGLDIGVGIPMYAIKEDGTYCINFDNYQKIGESIKLSGFKYDKQSTGRVVVTYKNSEGDIVIPNKAGVMCLPREIGYIYPKFSVQPVITKAEYVHNDDSNTFTITYGGSYKMNDSLNGSAGYSAVTYAVHGMGDDQYIIDRSAALQQDFVKIFSDRSDDVKAFNLNYVTKTGMFPAVSMLFKPSAKGTNISVATEALCYPYKKLNSEEVNGDIASENVFSMVSAYWTMLNRLFLPVNHFENCLCPAGTVADFSKSGVMVDPMESCFIFGLCGFLPSDYGQDIELRTNEIMNLGINYVEDLWIKSSLIFRKD